MTATTIQLSSTATKAADDPHPAWQALGTAARFSGHFVVALFGVLLLGADYADN